MDSYKLKKIILIVIIVIINVILISMVSISVIQAITRQLKAENNSINLREIAQEDMDNNTLNYNNEENNNVNTVVSNDQNFEITGTTDISNFNTEMVNKLKEITLSDILKIILIIIGIILIIMEEIFVVKVKKLS